jgi:hypothetical protein
MMILLLQWRTEGRTGVVPKSDDSRSVWGASAPRAFSYLH